MQIAGMIIEYNPMHSGHLYLLEETRRRLGADTAVIAVMSGNFVQRGDFALLRKHARARAAVESGVDLVLELPLPWAVSSAEGFAGARWRLWPPQGLWSTWLSAASAETPRRCGAWPGYSIPLPGRNPCASSSSGASGLPRPGSGRWRSVCRRRRHCWRRPTTSWRWSTAGSSCSWEAPWRS